MSKSHKLQALLEEAKDSDINSNMRVLSDEELNSIAGAGVNGWINAQWTMSWGATNEVTNGGE